MSRRNYKAIFERRAEPVDEFTNAGVWEEFCTEWVSLEPISGRELVESQQTRSDVTHKARLAFCAATSQINTKCRMKIARPIAVDESHHGADENYRIFGIESVINVREQNREMLVKLLERL